MANEEHVKLLREEGVEAWNAWRRENPDIRLDLEEANLSRANLRGADLREANLRGANLSEAGLLWADLIDAHLEGADLRGVDLGAAHLEGANLSEADLRKAILSGADLRATDLSGARLVGADLGGARLNAANLVGADLHGADLGGANLVGADLRRANLRRTDLGGADLCWADLREVVLRETVFGDTDLTRTKGLEECEHQGPSTLDHRTLLKSGPLPLVFLRGVGLPDTLIEYLPSLLNQPIQFYSCFISYSTTDGQEFAERLYADLQNNHVRCWFAPHDMPIGGKILDTIDEAIRLRDKVLLILSEGALNSDWVEGEVTRALGEERTRKQVVLFPVRIDDAVMHTSEAWARLLKDQRHIGDFTRWKDHDSYRKSLERVLHDLKITQEQAPKS